MKVPAVVIGGGFYGAAIASYLAQCRGIRGTVVLEREAGLLARASYANQARVHNGYHYPRSFTTAYRSQRNFPRFVSEFGFAVRRDFQKIYAVARRHSKVTAGQFERFCRSIDARIEPLPAPLARMFSEHTIEKAWLVEECAFDAGQLRNWAAAEIARSDIRTMFETRAERVERDPDSTLLRVACIRGDGSRCALTTPLVMNCTYSGLRQVRGPADEGQPGALKHEITEMALVDLPPALRDIAVTVMDGPFFSLMPFPDRNLHTLSHVRYTPHLHWWDRPGTCPYAELSAYGGASRAERMLRDAARFMPGIRAARHVDSLFEVKTVLRRNEVDDGRPILFEKSETLPGCYNVLGGKIDNIYDVLERLDREPLLAHRDSF